MTAAIDYATPDHEARSHRPVLVMAFVAAVALGANAGVQLVVGLFMLVTQPGAFDQPVPLLVVQALVEIGGVLEIACAVWLWRGMRNLRRMRQAAVLCAVTALLMIALVIAETIVLAYFGPRAGFMPPGSGWLSSLRTARDAAMYLCLFLPLLSLRSRREQTWRTSLLAIAAAVAFFAGAVGIMQIEYKAARIQNLYGGTHGQAIQRALRDPAPILGWWLVAGIAAALFFAFAMFRPGRVALIAGIGSFLVFDVTWAWTSVPWYFVTSPSLSDLPWVMSQFLNLAQLLIGHLAPAALIAWMLWREPDVIAPREAVMVERHGLPSQGIRSLAPTDEARREHETQRDCRLGHQRLRERPVRGELRTGGSS